MTCEDCLSIGIPERLCTSGKSVIETWENDEILYRRHKHPGNKAILKNLPWDIISSDLFKIHDDSYNRSSLCDAEDVLLNDDSNYPPDVYSGYGIISINVNLLNINAVHQINNDPRVFSLVPVHVPTDCNYAHAEIHCYVDGKKAEKKPKSMNTVFRHILIELFNVNKQAL